MTQIIRVQTIFSAVVRVIDSSIAKALIRKVTRSGQGQQTKRRAVNQGCSRPRIALRAPPRFGLLLGQG